MIRLSLWLAVVVLAVAVLTSWLLSRLIGKPLRGLASAMESFESDADHFTYRPVGGTREVQELSDSFEHMVLRIQELMTTVREEEVNLRKTELKALQAQINPHFLYNTLDSIAWMCEQGRNADAVKMVHALARLFRISISRGHELIPIAKELEHAESYLQIQMYRYKNQFTYTFDVDPDCLDYYCNKITLQPIIENSINHGLDLMVDEGRIDVRVRFDGDDIVFSVQDNGVGMSPEQLEAIMQHGPTDRTGIGIKNVNDRLKIYFGKNYGLHITSEPDVGTCVEIRMPRIREGDYETK
jgi:two-component system sensor histidine kinase YesM